MAEREGTVLTRICFNPLTGISSILTKEVIKMLRRFYLSFNPLTGISSILTQYEIVAGEPAQVSFNPLTGISSILTNKKNGSLFVHPFSFQSPDGDFVYSDAGDSWGLYAAMSSFNPLTGISSILTRSAAWRL